MRGRTGVHQNQGGFHENVSEEPGCSENHTQPPRKRKRNLSRSEQLTEHTSPASGGSYSLKTPEDVCEGILHGLNSASRPDKEACGGDLNLDYILDRVPYKQMLEDLFGTTGLSSVDVPVVSRAYEVSCFSQIQNFKWWFDKVCSGVIYLQSVKQESFMREPCNGSERHCVMGMECECNFIDKSNPFICMEFLLPGESPGSSRQMCVLCHRRFVQGMFHDIIYAGKPFRGVVQRYGNICGHDGEYAREVALICPPNGPTQCMPLPAISHQRNKYLVKSICGIKHVIQVKMSPSDFPKPPRGVPL